MAKWLPARRVVIIVDTVIQAPILEHVLKAGARGYNCVYCFGKGRHEVPRDAVTGRSLVRIELLVRKEVAEAIMDFIHGSEFKAYPIVAYIDLVEVDPRDEHFL